MNSFVIRGAKVVLEGKTEFTDVWVKGERIQAIGPNLQAPGAQEVIADGFILMPGVIDDQVHFREPGLTHKGEILTESRAAVAGGITSYMEMPNTKPPTLTQELLEAKYVLGARNSFANYSFFMGTSNDNLDEILKTNAKNVCGVKIFMGASTGNMLVDREETLKGIFKNSPMLISLHCESEGLIRKNMERFKSEYGENIPITAHPLIRDAEVCYASSSMAVEMAKEYGTRIHVLHISTARETALFEKGPVEGKRITAEACIHHLTFTDADYAEKGSLIKWNPAVKSANDRAGIWQALKEDRIDVIASDHAPHTLEEKQNSYEQCPSGGPLVQHALPAMLEHWKNGEISLEWISHKMSHAVAKCFHIRDRGFIKEGYFADLVLINPDFEWEVTRENILYKCGWSPFEGKTFSTQVAMTWVNGQAAWHEGKFDDSLRGKRMEFAPLI